MREILFKNLTSITSRKKDILLKEISEKDGVVARTERRCFYFIKDVSPLDELDELQKWLDSHGEISPADKRSFHIMKEHNDELGEDKLSCKIHGTFYAVLNSAVYTIAFLHSFKVHFAKVTLAK